MYLDKLHTLRLDSPDRFRAPMVERLGHRRLINTLNPSIKTIIPSQERHLDERIRTKATKLRDPSLSKSGKLEDLDIILANQIGESRLGETDPD